MHFIVRLIIAMTLFGVGFSLISFAVAFASILIGDDASGVGVIDDFLLVIICLPMIVAGIAAVGAGVAVLKGE